MNTIDPHPSQSWPGLSMPSTHTVHPICDLSRTLFFPPILRISIDWYRGSSISPSRVGAFPWIHCFTYGNGISPITPSTYDDDAVDALMSEPWIDRVFRTGRVHPNETSNCSWEHGYPPNVPPRQVINKCVTSGATKADLWRYALLYRYGGIYSDIDNSPTGFNGDTIKKHDDFFGTIEKLGILGQYFLAWQVSYTSLPETHHEWGLGSFENVGECYG